MLCDLFRHCFSDHVIHQGETARNSAHSNPDVQAQSHRDKSWIHQLLATKFSAAEEQVLFGFCKSQSQVTQDFLLMYLIQQSRYGEAIRTYEELFGKYPALHDPIAVGRQAIIDNIKLILPPLQRVAFELDEQPVVNRSIPLSQSKMDIEEVGLEESNIQVDELSDLLEPEALNQERMVESAQDDMEHDTLGKSVDQPRLESTSTPLRKTATPNSTQQATPLRAMESPRATETTSLQTSTQPMTSPFLQPPFTPPTQTAKVV